MCSLFFLFVCVCVCAVLGFDKVPWWGTLLISLGCAVVTALIVWFIVCPRLRKRIKSEWRIKLSYEAGLKSQQLTNMLNQVL